MIKVDKKHLSDCLMKYFGHGSFREGQEEIITSVLSGNDVIGILPTGTGKSICYQLPALMVEGTVIVVSPLISLMVDQVKQLKLKGIKQAIGINSFLDLQNKREILGKLNNYKLIYCSPEMLQNGWFLKRLKEIDISLFVIDEAHCISQWGHEFRTDYLKLGTVIEELGDPTVLALSATATTEVQSDIIKQLNRPNMTKLIYPMDRPNIAFGVEKVSNSTEKLQRIKQVLSNSHVPTMIYFTSKQWAEDVAEFLLRELPDLKTAFYHGGMEQDDRLLIQQQFMNNQLDVICCTSAFGMGVDKPNIRLVIHFHIPPQIESFIQEVGRAGRDGQSSVSLVFYHRPDEEIPRHLMRLELPTEEIIDVIFDVLQQQFDGIDKLHLNKIEPIINERGISEVQWRFLRYQFEKHGMIEENVIYFCKTKWQKAQIEIKQLIIERYRYKEEKFNELLSWIHNDGCRRTSLYEKFQKGIRKPVEFCCDACDLKLDKWHPEQVKKTTRSNTWDEELKWLFLQGV